MTRSIMHIYIHCLIVLHMCVYPAFLEGAQPVRSFVQGSMPVITGFVIGGQIGRYFGNERVCALTCASAAALLDHHCLKGYKDRHPVARKMGNVAPLACVLIYCFQQKKSLVQRVPDQQDCLMHEDVSDDDQIDCESEVGPVDPYNLLRMYIFTIKKIRSANDSFDDFYPEHTKESVRALVEQLADVKSKHHGGSVTASVKVATSGNFVSCVLEQPFADEVTQVWNSIKFEQNVHKYF